MDVIKVDLDQCVGHGKCYLVEPELMEPFDDEGHSRFVGDPIDPDDRRQSDLVDVVVASCPEEALSRAGLERD
jgi:ferredoxin